MNDLTPHEMEDRADLDYRGCRRLCVAILHQAVIDATKPGCSDAHLKAFVKRGRRGKIMRKRYGLIRAANIIRNDARRYIESEEAKHLAQLLEIDKWHPSNAQLDQFENFRRQSTHDTAERYIEFLSGHE